MNLLGRIYRSERIRLRRSWPLLAALLTPFSLASFLFTVFWFSFDLVKPQKSGFLTWYQISYMAWSLVFLPILATLMGTLSWELEAEAVAWRHRQLQPVPRWAHYASRMLGLGSLVVLANLIFLVAILAGGVLLRSGVPHLQMGAVQPWVLFRLAGASLAASLPLLAVCIWLPTRLPGMGLNLLATLLGCLWAFRTAGTSFFGMILPWGWISQVVSMVLDGQGSILRAALGAAASTLLFALVGLLDTSWRDEPRSLGGA